MPRANRTPNRFVLASLLGLLTACGGSGGDDPEPNDPAPFGTLGYAVTRCSSTSEAVTIDQDLRIGREGEETIVVKALRIGPLDPDTPVVFPFASIPPQPVGIREACRLLGQLRLGSHSVFFFYVQDVAVSPDGDRIVFEVTDNFSPLPGGMLAADDEGIFVVQSDGSGLRRIADARTVPSFVIEAAVSVEAFAFRPDGGAIVFIDGDPERAGGTLIVTLDLDDATRTVVTQLPPAPPAERFPATCCASFIDSDTVAFSSTANPRGLNPGQSFALFTVDTDGSALTTVGLPLPGEAVSPSFAITGDQPAVTVLEVPPPSGGAAAPEIFFFDEEMNLLQLTNYRRQDTLSALLDLDGETIFFPASADPAGSNPDHNCQLFSVSTIGGTPNQLTSFGDAEQAIFGCLFSPFPGCAIGGMFQDPDNGSLIFHTSCDPLGTNPFGDAIFAIRRDGSGLRQITQTLGAVTEDGIDIVEQPSPYGYRSG